MTDYSRNLSSAIKSIHGKGRDVGLVSYTVTGPSYDPVTTPTVVPTMAVQSSFKSNEVDGTVIMSTDRKYLFAGDVVPAIGMSIQDGGVKYEIKNVWQVKPGDTLILSKVQARL